MKLARFTDCALWPIPNQS